MTTHYKNYRIAFLVSLSIAALLSIARVYSPDGFRGSILEILILPGILFEGWINMFLILFVDDPYHLTEGLDNIINFLVHLLVISGVLVGLLEVRTYVFKSSLKVNNEK